MAWYGGSFLDPSSYWMHSKMATAALLVVSLMLLAPMAFSLLANTMAPSHELVDSNWDQSSWVKYLLRWSQALAVLVGSNVPLGIHHQGAQLLDDGILHGRWKLGCLEVIQQHDSIWAGQSIHLGKLVGGLLGEAFGTVLIHIPGFQELLIGFQFCQQSCGTEHG